MSVMIHVTRWFGRLVV